MLTNEANEYIAMDIRTECTHTEEDIDIHSSLVTMLTP